MSPSQSKSKVYCFINGQFGSRDLAVVAIAQDGHVLASHISSGEGWAKRDIGCIDGGASSGHLAAYAEHYPDGYELEWVDSPGEHAGLRHAFRLNDALAAEAEVPTS